MTANSTCCEANLFSDDLKSREMKRTPVFGNSFFPGIQVEQQYPGIKKDTPPNKPDTDSVCQSDDPVFCSSGSASTPVENIAVIGYFEEIRDLIRKKHVNLAGFNGSPFLPPVLCRGRV